MSSPMTTGTSLRSYATLSAIERHQLWQFLAKDRSGNALLLTDCLLSDTFCDVRVLPSIEGWNVAAARFDLPFHNLSLLTCDELVCRSIIAGYRDRFAPGDLIYSLLPPRMKAILGQTVSFLSQTPELLFSQSLAKFRHPDVMTEQLTPELTLRILGNEDLPSLRRLMQVGDRFAFSEQSVHHGIYQGIFHGDALVCAVGTQTLTPELAEIGNLVTSPDYRRRGLARACINELLRNLKHHTSWSYLFCFTEPTYLGSFMGSLGFTDPNDFTLVAWEYPST